MEKTKLTRHLRKINSTKEREQNEQFTPEIINRSELSTNTYYEFSEIQEYITSLKYNRLLQKNKKKKKKRKELGNDIQCSYKSKRNTGLLFLLRI